jgi:hypothetical protein
MRRSRGAADFLTRRFPVERRWQPTGRPRELNRKLEVEYLSYHMVSAHRRSQIDVRDVIVINS